MNYWQGWMNWPLDKDWKCETCGERQLIWGLVHGTCRCDQCHTEYRKKEGEVDEMEAGRELDTLVAQAMGWKRSEQQPYIFHDAAGHCYVVQKDWHPRCPHTMFLPSTDATHAISAVEHIIGDGWVEIELMPLKKSPYFAQVALWIDDGVIRANVEATSGAKAIALALSRAVVKASNETLLS